MVGFMVAGRRHVPGHEHHHRDISGGTARAAVFGMNDGLVSNVALILGVAGTDPAPGIVRLVGLSALIAGAVSMASGEYVSMQAQRELFQREIDLERREIARVPDAERAELAAIYRSRGIDRLTADEVATQMMRDPEIALETHAREELGLDPSALGSPLAAAGSSFATFALGALLPLLPWFFGSGGGAVVASILLGGLAALAVGGALARFTDRSMVRSALRQLAIVAVAATFTYAVGAAVT